MILNTFKTTVQDTFVLKNYRCMYENNLTENQQKAILTDMILKFAHNNYYDVVKNNKMSLA